MVLKPRDCNLRMYLDECNICGQYGWLETPEAKLEFQTTDGCGEFFGQLLHVLNELLWFDHAFCDRHTHASWTFEPGLTTITGRINWDYLGDYFTWTLTRQLTADSNSYSDFTLLLHSEECVWTTKSSIQLELPFRDFCYAVAKCGTEVIKKQGIIGYFKMAEQYEDFNLREFLQIKAFALYLSTDGFGPSTNSMYRPSFSDELELLLFDM